MRLSAMRSTLSALFAICALSALMDALFPDARSADCLRMVCGLSIVMCVARMAAQLLM